MRLLDVCPIYVYYYYIMKPKLLLCLALLLAFAVQTAPAFPGPAETAVFAPFVSRLQGELRNNLIRLSWEDSPAVRGPVYVFRSDRPFERSAPLAGIRSVQVPYGVQFYVDEVEAGETEKILYFFAVASDGAGRIFDIPIIYTNMIRMRIPAAGDIAHEELPPEPVFVPPAVPAGISSLQAVAEGNRVIITFAQGQGTSGAVLYRSVSPIRQTADILGAVIVQMGISSPFTDYPVPGIPFYYAVILEQDLIRGMAEIIPGQNATIASVEAVPTDPAERRRMRPMPLPPLSAQGVPPPRDLSPEALRALEELPPRPEAERMRPRVFARDLAVPHGAGEDFALSLIVSGPFAARNWEAARNELVGFLSLPRSAEAQARARFYLGQSYYFMRMPREGLFEFLAIQERHPAEAMVWIQAALNMLKEQ